MITAAGYQPLVTQLYFTGDPWLEKDGSSSSPTAKRRILDVQTLKNGSKKVEYNISMSETLAAEPAAIDRLVGIYADEKDITKKTELFRKNNQLWIKSEPFGMNLEYVGNNTFKIPGVPVETLSFVFEIMTSSIVKMTETYSNDKGEKQITVSVKGQ